MITDREIMEYYKWQGEVGDHQKQMYETGDLFTRYWQNRRREVVESLIGDLIEKGEVNSLLDVGCAEGLYTRFLAHKRSCSVGIDISLPKLIRARSYSIGLNCDYILASAENLPFAENSFDLVICIDVLRYLRDPKKAYERTF